MASEQAAANAIEGERKTVTALFADLKGSIELMETLDPEEARHCSSAAVRVFCPKRWANISRRPQLIGAACEK